MSNGETYQTVVGVDGSAGSKEALRWALWHTRLAGGHLTAVMSWDLPALYDLPLPSAESCDRDTEKALRKAVAEVAEDAAVDVRQEVARGHPAKALLAKAQQADLLVVGSRGLGGFSRALLGSVGQYCVTHAACPVVVVRQHKS